MKTKLQLDLYKVEFDVPDGSKQKGNELRAYIVFPGDNQKIVFGEILPGYTKIDDINRDHFISELAKKYSALNMEFSEMAQIVNRFGVKTTFSSIPERMKLKGHEALHLRLNDHGYTSERYLIWLAEDVVFDLYLFYFDEIESIIDKINLE